MTHRAALCHSMLAVDRRAEIFFTTFAALRLVQPLEEQPSEAWRTNLPSFSMKRTPGLLVILCLLLGVAWLPLLCAQDDRPESEPEKRKKVRPRSTHYLPEVRSGS